MARKFFETTWQSIDFKPFTDLSRTSLPTASFYDSIYENFFSRYSSYDELSQQFKDSKIKLAEWIADRIEPNNRVLSIGAGIGFVEMTIIKKYPEKFDLSAQDFSTKATKWLAKIIEPSKILSPVDGHMIPPESGKFDNI